MSQSSSLLSALPPRKVKKSNQLKALFIKSATLQLKQIGTNLCQILTPIICLLFTLLIQIVAKANMTSEGTYDIKYPMPLGYLPKGELSSLVAYSCPQWFLIDVPKEDDKTNKFLGNKYGSLYGVKPEGMLGNIRNMTAQCSFYYQNQTWIGERVFTPFFRQTNFSSINEDVAFRINYLNKNNELDENLMFIPDGGIKFHEASENGVNATLLINDDRTFQYHRASGITGMWILKQINATKYKYQMEFTTAEGQLTQAHMINSAYLKTVKNKSILTTVMHMPPGSNGNVLIDSLVNVVAATIFPLSLALLFPVFLYAIVLEKEERLIQMMKMNGMSMTYYWLMTFLFNLMLSLITSLIFYLFGYFLLKNTFFTQTPFSLMFVILFGWMLAQIGLSVLFQTFLSNSRTANIIGYLLSVWTSLIGTALNIGVFQLPTEYPFVLRMYAPLGFTRIFYIMLSKCSLGECINSWKGVRGELADQVIFLYVFFAFTFLLGVYLHQIIPQEYGVSRSPLYPFQLCKKKQRSDDETEVDPEILKYIQENDEDSDSKAERVNVERLQEDFSEYPLICNNLRKLYNKEGRTEPYAANKSFNLIIEPKQIFGLLGPNGAGKTTLISLITGMYEPDNGNAWVGGYSIKGQIEKVHLEMGVCPQFDLLWPELTVEQHLCFYARLKGSDNVKQSVKKAIQQVNLEQFTKFKTTQLSGGMKRRLSVAISLVGDPVIVFLDEPTTGLDPDNRRHLWSIISKCKQQRAVFLTTHMMDQADTLCNRIGIITNGVLRTINNQIKLKKKYGGGYRLDINLIKSDHKLRQSLIEQNPRDTVNYSQQISKHIENYQQIDDSELTQEMAPQYMQDQKKVKLIQFIKNNFQDSYLVKNFNTNFIFKLGANIVVSEVFELLSKHKGDLGISQWGVINSSLEDVFMAVVERFDKEDAVREDLAASVILTSNREQKERRSQEGDDGNGGEGEGRGNKSNRSSVLIEEVNNNREKEQERRRKQSDDSNSYVKNRQSVMSD